MISSVIYLLTVVCYVIANIPGFMSGSYKLIRFVNFATLVFLILEYSMAKALSITWLGVQEIHIFLFAECLVFQFFNTRWKARFDYFSYLPLVTFSFLLLSLEYLDSTNLSVFIIGSMCIEFLIKRKTNNQFSGWKELIPLMIFSFLLFAYQYNDELTWSLSIPLITYLTMGKNLPLPSRFLKESPFQYPLIGRVLLIGLLSQEFSLFEDSQLLITIMLSLFIPFVGFIVIAESAVIRWNLFRRGTETIFLGIILLFGWTQKDIGLLNLFVCVSLASFYPLVHSHLKMVYPRLSKVLFGLSLLYISGISFGIPTTYLKQLTEQIVSYGDQSQYMAIYAALWILIVGYSILFVRNDQKKRIFRRI